MSTGSIWFDPNEKPSDEDRKIVHALNRKIEAWELYVAEPTKENLKAHLKAVEEYNRVIGRDTA